VSVTRFEDIKRECIAPISRIMDFYSIDIKRNFNVKMKYGQQAYDFDEGILFCMSPGQVLRVTNAHTPTSKPTGWHLLIHPDLLWNTPLAKNIKKYAYFDYAVNEALFLSPKKEELLIDIIQRIDQECRSNVDQFSNSVIIAQIELLLTYTERFYQSTQQHIHEKLIEKAKEKLSTTELSVSEIAYTLGFEHPQSFSKLFKTKTRLSPVEFRQAFQ
jgi:AraC family transcriptional activator of pobA